MKKTTSKSTKPQKGYFATVGINYVDSKGKDCRVEAGEEVKSLPEKSGLAAYMKRGHIVKGGA